MGVPGFGPIRSKVGPSVLSSLQSLPRQLESNQTGSRAVAPPPVGDCGDLRKSAMVPATNGKRSVPGR